MNSVLGLRNFKECPQETDQSHRCGMISQGLCCLVNLSSQTKFRSLCSQRHNRNEKADQAMLMQA